MRQQFLATLDLKLLLPVFILCILGLATLLSVSGSLFRSQLLFFLFSILIYFIVSQINIPVFTRYSLAIYIAALLCLTLVLLLGIESHGAIRWIDILGFRIQFAELFKPLLAFSLSNFLTLRGSHSLKKFLTSLFFLFPVVLLIVLQPDLGSALIYLFAALFLLIIFGFPWYLFAGGVAMFLLTIPVLWQFLHTYQRQRILSFIEPTHDPLGTSYNAIQSVIAVGSGSFAGRGIGEGTQSILRFLPERHTDFIFATLTEGLGFIGSLLILISFVFLLWRIYHIFITTTDSFAKNFAAATFGLILIQSFINIGMNIGMLPVVGVPLPFVSYGGSSLVANFLLLGLLSAITSIQKTRSTLEIR